MDIIVPMVKCKFTFFQVQIKGIFTNAPKLTEPSFCHSPKVLNPVDMVDAISELLLSVLNSIMLLIPKLTSPS